MSLQQIIADLTAAADELQAEIDRRIDEHGAIGRALAELRGTTVTVAVTGLAPITATIEPAAKAEPKPVAKVDGRGDAVRARASQRANCPECGVEKSVLGLGAHRSKAHGVRSGQSAPAAGIAPVPAVPATAAVASENLRPGDAAQPSAFTKRAKVLACTEGECEFECPIDKGHVLNNHTHTVHGRRPHTHERMPVDAAVTASAA